MKKAFKILHRSKVYEGFLKLARYQVRHDSFHGGSCEPVMRERLELSSAVSVLPYDPVRDEVVLIEQFRIGVMEDPEGPWIVETIGGYREPDETAESVACRELDEEAGLSATELRSVGAFYVSPGTSAERIELFVARVDADAAGGVHGLAEEGEETRVVTWPAQQAFDELFARVNSTSTLILVQWLAAHREQLRAAWR